MNNQELYQFIQDPESFPTPSINELKELVQRYPYSGVHRLAYVLALDKENRPEYKQELSHLATVFPSTQYLFKRFSEIEKLFQIQQKGDTRTTLSTDSLIDRFLEKKSDKMPTTLDYQTQTEYPLIMDLSQNIDQSSKEENAPDPISMFVEQTRKKIIENVSKRESSVARPETSLNNVISEESMTESLAKVYIKQGRYLKALEIIRRLSLKYPEKNVYFADQIRFLEKLITNIKEE